MRDTYSFLLRRRRQDMPKIFETGLMATHKGTRAPREVYKMIGFMDEFMSMNGYTVRDATPMMRKESYGACIWPVSVEVIYAVPPEPARERKRTQEPGYR
jgi:hypothetical protein